MRSLKFLIVFLKLWIPLVIVISCLSLLVYGAVQQTIRSSANDPQIQIAEDVADNLNNGLNPSQVMFPRKVDIAKSLATYVVVYDNSGKVIASSAQLDGKDPQLPRGVFDYVRKHGQDRITWEPKTGVRSAVVVTRYKDGFVLAGRSMREIENRESRILKGVFVAWFFTIVATFGASAFFAFLGFELKRAKNRKH